MRIITIVAATAALAFATASNAQTQTAPSQAPAQPAPAPQAPAAQAPEITSVKVVDVKELPEATQTQVSEVVAQRGEEDLVRLRASIDGMPHLVSALKAKGATSADVIAASMGQDGALTLITRKAS